MILASYFLHQQTEFLFSIKNAWFYLIELFGLNYFAAILRLIHVYEIIRNVSNYKTHFLSKSLTHL